MAGELKDGTLVDLTPEIPFPELSFNALHAFGRTVLAREAALRLHRPRSQGYRSDVSDETTPDNLNSSPMAPLSGTSLGAGCEICSRCSKFDS